MGILTPISFEVFHSLTQLFEFFVIIIQLYEIFRIFSNESSKTLLFAEFSNKDLEGEELESSYDAYLFQLKYKNLQTNIVRIKDFLDSEETTNTNTLQKRNPSVFSLAEATIALESLQNLLSALENCRDYIDKVIPFGQSSYTDLFFATHQKLLTEMKDFILIPIISKNLKLDWLSNTIVAMK